MISFLLLASLILFAVVTADDFLSYSGRYRAEFIPTSAVKIMYLKTVTMHSHSAQHPGLYFTSAKLN